MEENQGVNNQENSENNNKEIISESEEFLDGFNLISWLEHLISWLELYDNLMGSF